MPFASRMLSPCLCLQVLFAYELQRRLGPLGVEACAVDPGGVRTSIWEHISIPGVQTAVDMAYAPAADAAQGVVHAATVPWDVVSFMCGCTQAIM